MAELEFRELRKVFTGGAVAVESLDLVVADGEFLVLVGPSGSGKTTVLRMASILERASAGDVLIGEEIVNDEATGGDERRSHAPMRRRTATSPWSASRTPCTRT